MNTLNKSSKIKKKVNPSTGESEYAYVSESKPTKVLEYLGKKPPSKEKKEKLRKRTQFFKNIKEHPKTMKKVIKSKKLKKKISSRANVWDVEAAYERGVAFRFGFHGFPTNIKMAVHFLVLSSARGHIKSTEELLDMFKKGEITLNDLE
jgi:hypothetical protein